MPSDLLNVDASFPQFTGEESVNQKLDRVMSYLYMVLEQLRYTLSNLDSSNFNETGLLEITDPIYITIEDVAGNVTALSITAQGLATQVENVQGDISALSQTAEDITARVESAEGDISTLTQTAEGITARVESAEGSLSTLTQTAADIESRVSDAEGNLSTVTQSLDGVVYESSLAEGATVINGGCISTGKILASYIKLGGDLEVYKRADSADVGGYLGFTTSANDGSEAMHMASSSGSNEVVVTDNGAALQATRADGEGVNGVYALPAHCYVAVGDTVYRFFEGGFLSPTEGATLGNGDNYWSAAYVTSVYGALASSSDERKKHHVAPIGMAYERMFRALVPCAYRYNSEGETGPVHLGFTAQGVRRAMEQAGLGEGDFAGYVENGQELYLKYPEFIALNTRMIQGLLERCSRLEERVARLEKEVRT